MRCACQVCDTYMVHSEGLSLGCVCPNCGNRCRACLGTDSVVSRENLRSIQYDRDVMEDILHSFDEPAKED